MILFMVDNVLIMVIYCESSCELWEMLAQIFISQYKPINMQIQSTKKGSFSVSDYFNKIKKLADSLAIGGNALSSNGMIMHLLFGLDDRYESLVTNILTRLEKDQLLVEEVYYIMLSYEIILEMNKEKFQSELLHDMFANFAKEGQCPNKPSYGNLKDTNLVMFEVMLEVVLVIRMFLVVALILKK